MTDVPDGGARSRGVAALADRPVDERRVALVMAAVGVVAAVACVGLVVHLASTARVDDEKATSIEVDRAAARARYVERQMRLHDRRRWAVPITLAVALLALGPIKRAFSFDRATPLSLGLWPALVIGGHLALGRPLRATPDDPGASDLASFQPGSIDPTFAIGLGVLGLAALLVASALVVAIGSGPIRRRVRRHVATLGWSAAASTSITTAWVGFALGPWRLSPAGGYLPVLFGCAATAALVAAALVLAGSPPFSDRGPPAASPPTARR